MRLVITLLLLIFSSGLYSQSYKIVPGNVLDFGEVEIGTNKVSHVLLINLSDTPLIITNVFWGEPCFAPGYAEAPVFKGDTLVIKYAFYTFSMPAGTNVSKSSLVQTNHGSFSIFLKAKVVRKPELLNGDTVFQTVEHMPEFKGGETDMVRHVSKNFSYPEQEELQFFFRVSFIIDTTGKVVNPEIINPYYNNELTQAESNLLEVFKAMPAWTPGWHNGRKVPVRVQVPVHIKIK
ncbi:MAG TPA: hypothetical protein VEC12_07725 [Bacteroidia bacterium]|nr:hypothetical protein [Bacteroidia bacterium]